MEWENGKQMGRGGGGDVLRLSEIPLALAGLREEKGKGGCNYKSWQNFFFERVWHEKNKVLIVLLSHGLEMKH